MPRLEAKAGTTWRYGGEELLFSLAEETEEDSVNPNMIIKLVVGLRPNYAARLPRLQIHAVIQLC